jgi:DNA anti-recombination protein RmuC
MDQQEMEESIAALAGALSAISERLERDLAERNKLVQALNGSVQRIATLEKQVGDLVAILKAMRDIQ